MPAIGDYNSVQWILHRSLGEDVVLEDDLGEPVRLRLVGLLQSSVLQSELIVSEEHFVRHFPSRGGYGAFFVDAEGAAPGGEPVDPASVATLLEARLDRFGFDATPTVDRLAGYLVVENTYMSTFTALGGLGLLLGTIGLGIVLVRNVIERRGELATLRAFGYRQATLAWMVLWENAFLLAVGLAIGTGAGLVAVGPHLLEGGAPVAWGALFTTLGLVFAVGMTSCLVAVVGAVRVPLLPVLKAEAT